MTQGTILKHLVDVVREQKGEPGVEELRRNFGDINFLSSRNYPVEMEVKLYNEVIKVLYGKYNAENYQKIVRKMHEFFFNSVMGKTALALVRGFDLKKLALNAPKISSLFSSENVYKVYDAGENKVRFVLENTLYPVEYWKAQMVVALDYFKLKGTIEETIINPHHQEYLISWEKPNN